MKTLFLFSILICINSLSFGQKYGDPSYYLIDSLDLDALSEYDKILIDTNLINYHSAAHDTDKISALSFITAYMSSERWHDYQDVYSDKTHSALTRATNDQVAKKLYNFLSIVYNNYGFIHRKKGQIETAISYYQKSRKIAETLESREEMAGAYNNLAMVYELQLNYDKALQFYLLSLDMWQSSPDSSRGQGFAYNNIGAVYRATGEYEKALEYYRLAVKKAHEAGNSNNLGITYSNIGGIFRRENEMDSALYYFNLSLGIHQEQGVQSGISSNYTSIGHVYYELGQKAKAYQFVEDGLAIAQKIGNPERIEGSAKQLQMMYQKDGRYKESLAMYELQVQMRDSINNINTLRYSVEQDAKYEYEKKKIADESEAKRLMDIQKEKQKRQEDIAKISIIAGVILFILVLFVINRLLVSIKQKKAITSQKKEIEHQHVEIQEAHQEITDSIAYAKRIQSAILPPSKMVLDYLPDSFVYYRPKDVVAGDFYWMDKVDDTVLFAAADCTGHGVPGAMVSVVCNGALNRTVREFGLTEPAKILDKAREIVIEEFVKSEEDVKDGMDIALCSLQGSTLQYAGANNPLWIIRNNEILETKADKQPIGKFEAAKSFNNHTIEVQKGDCIYVFSDGFVDQFGGEKGKKFKPKALRELLLSIQDLSLADQKQALDEAFDKWRGSLEQIDDVCMIGVKI